ncbi:hypothetical protein [Microbacterium sp. JAI119]|uniref:hypothetical protein n=1 Tax=Microbacterium sp. JAI119 TaxID=2723062 RepID=UPI0015C73692|nr:hypothetical protein [Microbacterium sp. JAI119]NYF29695.1 hypothetical protein [Microbacterium sp. JAI119]
MRPHGSRDRAPIPSEPDPARGSPALGAGGVWVAAAAAAAGVGSAYWDDSWHTTLGRDSTFIPPHLLLYASILTVGVVIAGWGWRRLAATRSVAAVFRTPGFALAVAAAVATAAAAPADAFWHTAFGRDAVLWSPPHLLSVIGTLCVLIGLLTGTDRHVPAPPRIALAAGVLGAALIIVMEYDTDVPQFTETLYLPLLLATTLGAAWVITTLVPGRTRLVLVVAVYLVFRVVLWVLLTTSGWLAPDLPVAVAGGRPRRDHPATAGLRDRDQQRPTHPRRLVRRRHHHGDHRQHDRPHRAAGDSPPIRRRGRGPHPLLVALAPPPPAQAHDPGQGTAYGTAQMTVTGDGTGQLTVTITGIRLTDDTDLTPSRLVARRTGEDLTAPLRAQPGTPPPGTFTGELALPSPGLWFVYAQFATGERTLEVWVPVDQQLTGPQSQQRNLYQPVTALTPSPGQIILGAVLLAVSTALTVAAAVTVARRRRVLPPATT